LPELTDNEWDYGALVYSTYRADKKYPENIFRKNLFD
jgi:hypothetical protein